VYAYDKSGGTDKAELKVETNGEHEAGDDIYFSYLKVYPKREGEREERKREGEREGEKRKKRKR